MPSPTPPHETLAEFPWSIQAFVEECCLLSPTAQVTGAALQATFSLWRGYSLSGPELREATWEALCQYLRHRGCTRELDTGLCRGLTLTPHAPRPFPALSDRAHVSGDPLSYWRTTDAYRELEALFQWLSQRVTARLHRHDVLTTVDPSATDQDRRALADTWIAAGQAYQENLRRQLDTYMARRQTPFEPHKVGQTPTAADIQLACDLFLEWQEEAFTLPFVRETLFFLRGLGKEESLPLASRRLARTLVQHLYAHLTPCATVPPLGSTSLTAVHRRQVMLAAYEEEHRKLRRFFDQPYHGLGERLMKLQQLYPTLEKDELRKWTKPQCADIAQSLVAREYNSTAETIRKHLSHARKDRQQFEAQGDVF